MKYIVGDLVASHNNNELDAYAHQCNCFCRMGRGIAPLLAKANPEVRQVDNITLEGDRNKLGGFTKTNSTKYKPVVYNIYGQYHWSKFKVVPTRNTNYEALKNGLIWVREDLHKVQYDYVYERQMTLGLPLIGCGLAGGDWKIVSDIIEEVFLDSGVDVTIFVMEKDKYVVETVGVKIKGSYYEQITKQTQRCNGISALLF